jgi:hypothetical protein
MQITFDSNTYRRIATPEVFAKDPRYTDFGKIHRALTKGIVTGYLSETILTLEGIQNAQRPSYFSASKLDINITECEDDHGAVGITIELGPRDSTHPGLHPMIADAIKSAMSVGMRFLRAPRIGMPRPVELIDAVFAIDSDAPVRQARFFDLSRELENRGFGIAAAKRVGEAINKRLGKNDAWFSHLDQALDANEEAALKRAVAEWADGDTVAAHYSYGNDFLCTEDVAGNSARKSVFDQSTRSWLSADFHVKMCTIQELSGRLGR